MRFFVFFYLLFGLVHGSCGQQDASYVIGMVDQLTVEWNQDANGMRTFAGMKEYCKSRELRDRMIKLIKEIHHYDSLLYSSVRQKYDDSKDMEAFATLQDIKKLEQEYTTASFLDFLHSECRTINDIERNFSYGKEGKSYTREVTKMEKELVKYVDEITFQIDIIGQHIYHIRNF